jgi:hypothetical protein
MENKSPVIQAKLNGLCEKMRQSGYEEFKINWAIEIVNELQQIGVQGLDTFVGKLSERLDSEDEYRDILKEGRFARALVKNGFRKIEIEYTKQGPDVKAYYNKSIVYFEIRRIRENKDDKAIDLSKDGVGWISPYRIDNLRSIILDKKKQLKADELNIVVLWSDTRSLDKRKFEETAQVIQQEIDSASQTWRKVSGILFTTGGVSYSYGTPKQFHLFINDKADQKLPNHLANKLQSMTEEDPRKLHREYEGLVEAMKKHSR